MTVDFVTPSGERWNPNKQTASFVAKPKVAREQAKAFHKGWSVEGYPPKFLVDAEAKAVRRLAEWQAMTPMQQAKKIKDGDRIPKPWDEARFMAKNKRHKVRNRPFEIVSAAEQCKGLAERDGWTHVQVTALTKGETPAAASLW